MLDAFGSKVEQDADEGMVAAAISGRTADEGEDRQRQPGDLVRPQKRRMEINAGDNIGEHKNEFAKQRHDNQCFGDRVDGAHGRMGRSRTDRGRLSRFGFGAGLQAERIEGMQGLHDVRR